MTSLDLQHSRRRSASVFGPMAVPSRDVAVERLHAMAAAGPAFRLGLRPSAHDRRWHTVEADDAVSVTEVAPLSRTADPLDLLRTVRGMPETGLRVVLAGEWVAIDFSHGLGDVAFSQAVVDVMLGGVALTDPHWAPYRRGRHPLAAAAARTFGGDTRRLIQLARLHRAGRNAADSGPETPTRAASRSTPSARTIRIDDSEIAELRAARDRHLPGVSMFAIVTCALLRSLSQAGIDVRRDVTIPFDARPYLPRRMDTLASFSAGLTFPLDTKTPAPELKDMITAAYRSGRPVANLVVSSTKLRIAGSAPDAESPWRVAADPAAVRAELLHSYVGRIPQTQFSPFTDPDLAFNYTVSDPVSPAGITVTSSTVGDHALCLSAAFHADVTDGDRVSDALASVVDQALAVISE
ncbi:hypothetical protein VZC37_03615 [Gordonia sp. LSe1-13]|uniref:Acyltransferase PapA5 n=1 Tax=Gordonia sesuvii TaxID=3116777 RepID=A0ABU7M8M2_9ACTN|nr:hypothetical protein [Gordonia sp. LSe1-13]